MSTVVIIGCGNIGYRHLQAATSTDQVSRVVVVEPRGARRDEIASTFADCETPVDVAADIRDVEAAVREAGAVIVAVTADRQPAAVATLAEFGPQAVILEKPVSQSSGQYAAVSMAFEAGHPRGGVYVNCARALFSGWRTIRHRVADDGAPIRMSVRGTAWGYGCNALHFLELFRFLTGGQALECALSDLRQQPGGSKRGPRYAEYVGAAAFQTPFGDRLTIECGDGEPSTVGIEIRARGTSGAWMSIDERADQVTDHRLSERFELGGLPVSRSTSLALERILQGVAPGLPTLREVGSAQEALFASLERSTGARVFAIT